MESSPGPSPAVAHARARLAGLHAGGRRDPSDPAILAARRELEVLKLVEQAARVAALLHPAQAPVVCAPVADERWCRHCDQVRPLSAFGPDGRARDGLRSLCKHCEASQARERYQQKIHNGDTGLQQPYTRENEAATP